MDGEWYILEDVALFNTLGLFLSSDYEREAKGCDQREEGMKRAIVVSFKGIAASVDAPEHDVLIKLLLEAS